MRARRLDVRLPIALLIPTLALSLAAAGDGILPGDARLARWLQANPIPIAEQLTAFTNDYAAGQTLTAAGLALALALLAARRPAAALLLALATAVRTTNGLLKSLVDSPRPTLDLVAVTEQAAGLGFPSGHAMGATLVLCAVAYLLMGGFPSRQDAECRPSFPPLPGGEGSGVRVLPGTSPHDANQARADVLRTLLRRAAVTACLALILLTGYGRILVGAHWPSDVLGGYLWGWVLLLVALRIARSYAGRGSGGVPHAAITWKRAA